jgi:uncharacterized protein YciI
MAMQTSAQEMLRAMLNKPLYVAMRQTVNLELLNELLVEHLQWAVDAERRGELFASGPFSAEGSPPGAQGGMTILRAASHEEALDILSHDPFVRDGAITVEVRKWQLMEGSMTVTVRLSDQSCNLL